MTKVVIGWMSFCFPIALCVIASVWLIDSANLMTAKAKVECTFAVLFIFLFISYLSMVTRLLADILIDRTFRSKESG